MKLYNYWRSSSSYRLRLALHHKGLPFEYVAVNLAQGAQHQDAHAARNPTHMVPVLELDDGALLTQSVAIFEYLEEAFPAVPLLPSATLARGRVRALAEVVNSSIQPLHNLQVLRRLQEGGLDEKAWAARVIREGLQALDALSAPERGRFLHGDAFTWADCCLLPQLYAARRFGASLDGLEALLRVETAVQALPCYAASRPESQPDAPPA